MNRSRTLRLCLLLLAATSAAADPVAATGTSDAWSFVSAPNLHPPRLDVLTRRPGLARGDFLVGAISLPTPGVQSSPQAGPLILDSRAQPVWFMDTKQAPLDFSQESYDAKPVLVWAAAAGNYLQVIDEHYRTVATIAAHSPWIIDGHDAAISGGDIWVTVVREVPNQNLSPYGGPSDGSVIDCGMQEYQLSTGRLIRTWDALNPGGRPNVPLSASEEPAQNQTVWDPYHINAVQALPDGDLLVSMRNTWGVYLLDPATGRILWTLGGKQSSFTFGQGAEFSWQHDARLIDPGDGGLGQDVALSLFNDDNDPNTERPSEGMLLRLDTVTRQAALAAAYFHHPPLAALLLGSMQLLPNGNVLVGWGTRPYFSEYTSSGRLLLDVEWPADEDQSYRALFTDTWIGTPYYPPSGAIRGRTVYASWNGATLVRRWKVLAGPSTGHLNWVATQPRTGFETAIALRRGYSTYEVEALGAHGHVLGTSKPFGSSQ
jgi:hypothetical protein